MNKLLLLSATMLTALAAPVFAEQAFAEELGTAPKGSPAWSIVSAGGKHGEEQVWTDKDGVRHARMNIVLRGLTYDIEQMTTGAPGEIPTKVTIVGETPSGDAGETFEIVDGVAKWTSPADEGEAPWRDNLIYVPFGGAAASGADLVAALLADEDHKLDALPGGVLQLKDLTTLDVAVGKKKQTLRAVAVEGLSFDPQVIWLDEKGGFFGTAGWLSWLPVGWESVREALIAAEQAALAKRAPEIRAALLKDPGAPVLFSNVTIYDAATNSFKKKMSVLVEGDKITAVAKKVNAPEGAVVFDGKGKTLVPGLWDMHHHFGNDGAGVHDLSQGVTSVRDIGNEKETLLAKKKRIDEGELLGPNIYPILGIDGDGPLSAQGFVRIHSVEEGIAAVNDGHAEGFLGIKLYGTINPEWVAPMAAEAHKFGMSVQGHIPAGMRPSEAVAAGYDGINHINFVVMEAMPDDVVATSNGLNRFFGPGRYAKDIDLSASPMEPFLTTLQEKKIVIDPTLTVYEQSFVPDQGEVAPSYEPYLGTVPPQVERGFKSGGLVAPEGYEATREDMRASFDKLVETVADMHKRGVPIVAGTDGYPSDLIRELELYVRAGMTIGESLETATDGAARVFGLDDKVGSIAEGQTADLLLVDGDVSKNIGALRQVDTVVLGGKLLDGDAMREAAGISGRPK
ncbi:MAG TPA: amidohydrolase family protein [Parvularculaceae bacterium]|nr:amidohydrolase family protein [Parvularculaceae bacterium]